MKVTSIEYLSREGVRANEDCFVIDETNGLFAVFDGASSLVPYQTSDGKTGARVAAEIARDTFAAQPTNDLQIVANKANLAIEACHEKLEIDSSKSINRFSCTVAASQFKDGEVNLLQNADSLILLKYTDGSVEVPLGYHDQDLKIMKKWRELADQGHKDIRQLIEEDVRSLRNEANVTFGVLNGHPEAIKFCKTMTVPLGKIAALLIITDGLFIPKEDPEEDEDWAKYFQVCEDSGLGGLLQTVRKIEKSDPELTQYPRYKIHDDATGIYIVLR